MNLELDARRSSWTWVAGQVLLCVAALLAFPYSALPEDGTGDELEKVIARVQTAYRDAAQVHHAMDWFKVERGDSDDLSLHSEFYQQGDVIGVRLQLPDGRRVLQGASNGDVTRLVHHLGGQIQTMSGVGRLNADQDKWNQARGALNVMLGCELRLAAPLEVSLEFGPRVLASGELEFQAGVSIVTGSGEPMWLRTHYLRSAQTFELSDDGSLIAFRWPAMELSLSLETGLPVRWTLFDSAGSVRRIGKLVAVNQSIESWKEDIVHLCAAPWLVTDDSEIDYSEGVGTITGLIEELGACWQADEPVERTLLDDVAHVVINAFLDQRYCTELVGSSVEAGSRRESVLRGLLDEIGGLDSTEPIISWIVDTLMDQWWIPLSHWLLLQRPLHSASPVGTTAFHEALQRELEAGIEKRVRAAWPPQGR